MIRASLSVRIVGALIAFASISSARAVYDIDVNFALDPPPARGSLTDRADYRELHRLQDTRTDAECEAAAAQSRMTADPLFGPRLGIVSDSEFRALQPMLEEVLDTVAKASSPFKRQYARVRPYDADRRSIRAFRSRAARPRIRAPMRPRASSSVTS